MINKINEKYWSEVSLKKIIGNNFFPSEELFERLEKGAKILDVGCGSGEIAEYLCDKGYKVTAIDINNESIRINKLKNSEVNYSLGDITEGLPFEDESFDAVILGFVLVNLVETSEIKKALLEIDRVLKSKGIIWLNEGTISPDYKKRYELSKNFLEGKYLFFVFKDPELGNRINSTEELEQAIKDDKIERITRHFEEADIEALFSNYSEVYKKSTSTVSPRSGFTINSVVQIFEKT